MAMPASFNANRLSLVDRGFVYAIAHIRGGADKGWGWYLDGKREKKTNSFDDFAASARALIDAKYTSAKRIVGHGGSAGGMLMGAVANRAGELFAGIVAEVPFVDVLNTMLDDTLPLTPPEWPEWGNPIESEKDFRTILSYSPYDNVAAKDYPAILAMGGLTDPRVTYWEPAKWIARLRATMTRRRPGAAAHQHGRRPRRRVGALRPARRSRDRLCVRAVGGGDGGGVIFSLPRLRGEGWGEGEFPQGDDSWTRGELPLTRIQAALELRPLPARGERRRLTPRRAPRRRARRSSGSSPYKGGCSSARRSRDFRSVRAA